MARWQQVRTALALTLITLVAAACTQPTGTGLAAYSCSTGSDPFFELFRADYDTRDTNMVKIPITFVRSGPFSSILWDVVELAGTNEPPQFTTYADESPTLGTDLTALNVHVYSVNPGTYGLRVRGRAYSGSFESGDYTLVGECFRPFTLTVF
jgi:hypothetical protein